MSLRNARRGATAPAWILAALVANTAAGGFPFVPWGVSSAWAAGELDQPFSRPPGTRPMGGQFAQADMAGRGIVAIEAGAGRIVSLSSAASSVFTADPKVVEVRPASPSTLFLFGVGPGRTTVAAMDAQGRAIAQYDVLVRPGNYGSQEAAGAIGRALPGGGVRVDQRPDGVTLQGTVSTPAEAEQAAALARGYASRGQTVSNRLQVAGQQQQVTLRVRVAEMSRSVTRTLGVNWQGLGTLGRYAVSFGTALGTDLALGASSFGAGYKGSPGGVDFNVILDALAQDQLVHLLAEPSLTAMSGEVASFLAGGEFPIPVAQQNNTISLEFKQYGVSLAFVPTVMSDGHISLKVRPEVSQLTDVGSVKLQAGNSSLTIPALTVRRAETTVELGSGQSFAIAGLLQDNVTHSASALPFLGELPVIGALFRSDNFKRQETELVIVVTPYLSRPVSDPRAIALPTDGYRPPSDFERMVLQRQNGGGGAGSLGVPAVGPLSGGASARPAGPQAGYPSAYQSGLQAGPQGAAAAAGASGRPGFVIQ